MSSLIPIPARTPATQCSSCGQLIYFAPHPSTGRPHPISIEHEDAEAPTPLTDGQGISHFSDCPTADQHRSGSRVAARVAMSALEEAGMLPLVGAPTSWDGYGGKPLGACPDKVLRAARRWFTQKLNESGDHRDPRFERQAEAIALILADRDANSPQGALPL